MNDEDYFAILRLLLDRSNHHARPRSQSGVDDASTEATQMPNRQYGILSNRDDSEALEMRLLFAQILHNQGMLDKANKSSLRKVDKIRRHVLFERQNRAKVDGASKLAKVLRSSAQSLGTLIKTTESGLFCKKPSTSARPHTGQVTFNSSFIVTAWNQSMHFVMSLCTPVPVPPSTDSTS